MLRDYKPQFDTPKRQGRLSLVYLQADIGASGAPTLDTANSSPNVTIARNTTGQYAVTFPNGTFAHFVGGGVLLAESAGLQVDPETLSASTAGVGVLTFETSASGTAADPDSGSKLFVTLLVGGV